MIAFIGFVALVTGKFAQRHGGGAPIEGPWARIIGVLFLIFAIYIVVVVRKEAKKEKDK